MMIYDTRGRKIGHNHEMGACGKQHEDGQDGVKGRLSSTKDRELIAYSLDFAQD